MADNPIDANMSSSADGFGFVGCFLGAIGFLAPKLVIRIPPGIVVGNEGAAVGGARGTAAVGAGGLPSGIAGLALERDMPFGVGATADV